MSLKFISKKKIIIEKLFDGRLDRHGIHEITVKDSGPSERCLSDGNNCLWISGDDEVEVITKYGFSAPGNLLAAIQETFDTVLYSEFRPRYLWEYTSNEDYQRSIREEDQEFETARYEEIMRYAKGGPFHIRDIDSLDDVLAFIAKVLIAGNPDFSRRNRKEELLDIANEILNFDSMLEALTNQSIETVRRVAIRETNRYLDGLSESG